MSIKIYTDGSCNGNPGIGGWGAIIILDNGKELEISGKEEFTTNNRMELSAAINALKSLKDNSKVEIFTDSTYVKSGITSWIQTWEKNNWKNSTKKEVKNKDLWLELLEQSKRHNIVWNWIRGHTGNKYNEKADKLAKAQCK